MLKNRAKMRKHARFLSVQEKRMKQSHTQLHQKTDQNISEQTRKQTTNQSTSIILRKLSSVTGKTEEDISSEKQ